MARRLGRNPRGLGAIRADGGAPGDPRATRSGPRRRPGPSPAPAAQRPPGPPPGPFQQVPSPSVGADVSELRSVSCVEHGALHGRRPGRRPASRSSSSGTARSGRLAPGPTLSTAGQLVSVSCTSPTFCVAVGGNDLSLASGPDALNIIEQWNGSGWSLVTSPNLPGGASDNLYTVSCTGPQFCMATGASQGTPVRPGVERDDLVAPGAPDRGRVDPVEPEGVSCTGPSFCQVVGLAIAGVVSTQVLEQWNGTGWLTLTNPTLPSISALESVSCVTMSWCTAVGLSSTSTLLGHVDSNLVEQWERHRLVGGDRPGQPDPLQRRADRGQLCDGQPVRRRRAQRRRLVGDGSGGTGHLRRHRLVGHAGPVVTVLHRARRGRLPERLAVRGRRGHRRPGARPNLHRDGVGRPAGLPLRRLRRRSVRLQYPVQGLDGRPAAQSADRGHGPTTRRRRLLPGRRRRGPVRLHSAVLGSMGGHPLNAPIVGMAADPRTGATTWSPRRRPVRLLPPRSTDPWAAGPSTGRSSAWPSTRRAAATARWGPTAGSSPSSPLPRLDGGQAPEQAHRGLGRDPATGATGRWPPTAACSTTQHPVPGLEGARHSTCWLSGHGLRRGHLVAIGRSPPTAACSPTQRRSSGPKAASRSTCPSWA